MEHCDEKSCPMCGQVVQGRALKCRFCGEFFDDSIEFGRNVWMTRTPTRVNREKQDSSTAVQILFLVLMPCFSPIVAVYGLVFLTTRRYAFPNKHLAVAGTILHWIWMTVWLVYVFGAKGN